VPKEKKGKRKKKTYDPSKWISLMEAARMMGVTRQVIADLIRRRRLRTLAVANKTLVLRSAVENFRPLQRSPKPKTKQAKKK
jgi:excisionase family DNA binding protein